MNFKEKQHTSHNSKSLNYIHQFMDSNGKEIIPALNLVATKIEHFQKGTPKFHEMLLNKHKRGQNLFNVIRELAHFKLELGAYFFAGAQQKWLLQNFCRTWGLILGVTE